MYSRASNSTNFEDKKKQCIVSKNMDQKVVYLQVSPYTLYIKIFRNGLKNGVSAKSMYKEAVYKEVLYT